jgi:outer membrane protein assembly factor BamB
MQRLLLGILFALVSLNRNASADDFPQWRGPERDGISKEKNLLQQWPAEGPRLVWEQKSLGNGYSTPSISNKDENDEFIQALSTKDGKQIWSTHLGKVGSLDQKPSYPGARSTPTVDGDFVYAFSSDGDLACLKAADGKIQWKKNVRTDFGGEPGIWAYAESPLVDGDALVVTPGGNEATMLKLDKKDGTVIWKGHPDQKKSADDAAPPNKGAKNHAAGYASIGIFNAAGKKQYIQFLGEGLVGVDAATGKFLWLYDHSSEHSPANIPTPVCADDRIYSGTQYAGGGLVKLAPDGDGIKVDEVYFEKKFPRAIGGQVLFDGNLYGTSKEQTQCLDFKSGEVKWTKDRGIAPASVLYADNRLYMHGETQGDVMLLEASPAAYKECGHFTPPDVPADRTGSAWAYPAIANGRLYIQDWGTMWCYDLKAGGDEKAAAREPATTTPSRN